MKLLLYYLESCRYCQKVLRFMKSNDIEIPMKDIDREPKAMDELVSITGRYTVPCLFIDNTPQYESDDIISWLKDYASSDS